MSIITNNMDKTPQHGDGRPSSKEQSSIQRILSSLKSSSHPSSASTSLTNIRVSEFGSSKGSSSSFKKPLSRRGSNQVLISGCSTTTAGQTPGSGQPSTPGGPAPSTIIAIVEGRGQARGEVGLAAIDLRCPQLSLAQFSDTHTYTRTITKLAFFNPLEVVVASTAISTDITGRTDRRSLVQVIQESLSGVSVTAVHRRYFNDTRGLAIIKHLASHACAYIERQISSKYYCLAAVAALMKYVEEIQFMTYAPHSLHITLSSYENTMCIEYSSCRKLELVRSLRGGWENSLFGALRYTRTPGGTRLLRASLLQPHADTATIMARHDTLQYLVENPELFYTLQSILGRFPDIDWLLTMCVQMPKEDTEVRRELRLNYVIALKNLLELLNPLKMALEEVTDPLLVSVKEAVSSETLCELLALLQEVMHEDARLVKGAASMRTQRCYAIKSNVNGLLDVARKIYSEIIEDITKYVEELGEELKLNLRVGHNAARGFHISIPHKRKYPMPCLPSILIQVQKGHGCVTCTTEPLYQLDQRSKDTLREILVMSNVIVLEMLVETRGRISTLYSLSEAIATLDLIVALAHAASIGSWVRPDFSQALALKGSRHPILDILSPLSPVPNNTFLSPETCVMVVTGPNMSGKSTYLRQIALLQILAQIGSFVPAEFASFFIVHQLFTHLGSEDSPESNASTFEVQMSDVAHMLNSADRHSLVLLDELGCGTSIEEGGSIAWAVMEKLIQTRVPTVLATHALFLTKLSDLYPRVSNYHLMSEDSGNGRLQLTHIVRPGVTQATYYGLALARVTAIPPSLLSRAQELAMNMMSSTEVICNLSNKCKHDQAVYHLARQLLALHEVTYIPSSALSSSTVNEADKIMNGKSKVIPLVCSGNEDSMSSSSHASDGNDGSSIPSKVDNSEALRNVIRAKLRLLLQQFMEQFPDRYEKSS